MGESTAGRVQGQRGSRSGMRDVGVRTRAENRKDFLREFEVRGSVGTGQQFRRGEVKGQGLCFQGGETGAVCAKA